jgi:hypothetical protein
MTAESQNSGEETAIARQRLGKHAATAADTRAKVKELLDPVFSVLSMLRLPSDDH